MYDVIVVGAGFAGCTAAKAFAEKEYKVLFVEKFKMLRYKSWSGVLIKKSMELVESYFGEEVPESAICIPTENRGMIFTDDRGKEYCFEQESQHGDLKLEATRHRFLTDASGCFFVRGNRVYCVWKFVDS